MFSKPSLSEVPAFYQRYILQLPDLPILQLLEEQAQEAENLFSQFSEQQATLPYAPGKWSTKQLLGHMIDTERIMAYRALCFSRGEVKSLPGFDENTYVENANFNNRLFENLLDEYRVVRVSSLMLFHNMDDRMAEGRGMANDVPLSVKTLAAILVAHERHHLNILVERYRPLIK